MDIELKLKELDADEDDADSVGSMGAGAGGIDTKRSISSDLLSESGDFFNDEGVDPPGLELHLDEQGDEVFQQIKDTVSQKQDGSRLDTSSRSGSVTDSPQVKTSEDYQSVPYGLQPRATYEHGKRSTEIMGVTYNGRMRQFIVVDSKGLTAWKRDAVDHRVSRVLHYPKYEYGLITHMVYAKKYNCYFALGKDFSLKVYNRDFYETCSVSADLRSVLFMLFNPIRDELITGGVGGTKVWRFHQQAGRSFTELKPLGNYGLTLKYELPNVGGSWVKRVELDHHLEHLYCCSDTDLFVYDLAGKLLFKFERAHMMSITGCRYSLNAGVLVTSSVDTEVKVWSLIGGLVHTFRGHSRAVTNLILHPATSSIIITCSLDGTVRMWSLDTMDTLYSLVVSADGVHWMGLTDDNLLFLSTPRAITLWSLNYSHQFWALARSKVTSLSLAGCKGKTTRVMAISDDSSVRLMARSNRKNLCTVLPPPSISPLQRVLSVCYSREFNVIFMLINPHEIWVYTTRTDPSCRIAVWDVIGMQAAFTSHRSAAGAGDEFTPSSTISVNKPAPAHRATENGSGSEALANCCCVAILNSTAMVWTEEGCCCPIRDSYLLLGLEDGRILFMDPVIKGHKYLEFKTGKDPVLDISHNACEHSLSTVHKLKDRMFIQVWTLPDLELQHEVYVAPDLRAYIHVGYVMICGHESGCVIFNSLELATDPGLNKGKMIPPYKEVIDSSHKPEHFAPVIGVDACPALSIFCSCSNDGAIKVWNQDGVLMTEIMMDESLTSICFLNNMGDLIVGFQKHVFFIDHYRVCPRLTIPESDIDSFDKESFICEDPAVLYEGVTPNPDPVTLESYLVPFDIEFSKDFLEGRVKLEPELIEEEESDKESEVSMAPTDIYLSPRSTPRRRLSHIDFLIENEPSSLDLLRQMKKTLAHLAEKAERRRLRKRRKKGLEQGENQDGEAEEKDAKGEVTETDDLDGDEEMKFEFPKFGESPGPSPVSTAPPTPEIQSEEEEEPVPVDKSEEAPDTQVTIDIAPKEKDDITKFLEAEQNKGKEVPKPSLTQAQRKKFGLSSYTIDAESLMKKKAPRPAMPTKPQTMKIPEVSLQIPEAKSPRKERQMKKRLSISTKRPSKSKKPDAFEETGRPGSPPSSQMAALELTQQSLDVPEKKRFEMPVVDMRRQSKDLVNTEKEALFENKLNQKEKQFEEMDKKTQDAKSPKIEMPELPSLPSMPQQSSDQTQTANAQQEKQTEGRPSLQTQEAAKRLAMDFSSVGAKPKLHDPSTPILPGVGDMPDGKSELPPATLTAANVDNLSILSGASEDGQAAFRIGLLSKQDADRDIGPETPPFDGMPEADSKVNSKQQQQQQLQQHLKQQQQQLRQKVHPSQSQPKQQQPPPPPPPPPQQQQQHQINKEKFVKNCSLKDDKGLKSEKSPKPSKLNSRASQRGRRGLSHKEANKTQAKNAPDPEGLLNALMEKQKNKELKSNTPPPPDFDVLAEALKKIGQSKSEESALQSNEEQPESGDKSELITQAAMTGPQGSYAVRDMYDHQLPSIPESETPVEESTDTRLLSPDFSIRRLTTPSVSVIENESIPSSSPAPSFSRGLVSPLPVLSEYPLHSSPLPPVDEISIASWPSEIANSDQTPLPIQNSADESSLMDKNKEVDKKQSVLSETTVNYSSISAVSFQSVPEIQIDSSESSTIVSSQKGEEQDPQIERAAMNEKIFESRMSSPLKESDDDPREAQSALDSSHKFQTDNTYRGTPQSPSLSSKDSRLNQNIDSSMTDPSIDSTVKEVPADLNESQSSSFHEKSPVSQVDISIKTMESSITQSVQQTSLDDNRGDASTIKHHVEDVVAEEEEEEYSEHENSGEYWDTDSNVFSPSDDSYLMTSSLSDSDSKHSKDTDKYHEGHASSSSNATMPVLQVKIRRKAWSHYRDRKNVKENPTDASRKLSHSDALTIQRKAYLETLRQRKKRARSAVEASALPSPRRLSLQQQQQQQHTVLEMSPSQPVTGCVLCAVQGIDSHSNHQSREEKPVKDSKKVFIVENKASLERKSEAASVVATDNDVTPVSMTPRSVSKTPGLDSVTLSDSQVSPVDKSPTPCDTPDQFNSQTASRTVSANSMSHFMAVSPDLSKPQWVDEQLQPMSVTVDTRRPTELNSTQHSDESVDEMTASHEDEKSPRLGMMKVELTMEYKQPGTSADASPKPEEEDHDKTEDKDLLNESTLKRIRERPKTSMEVASLGKPELDEAVKYFRRRPHTAQVKFQTELELIMELPRSKKDLQEAFDSSMTRYQKLARSPLASDNIHRNGDMAFSENWHQRQIERHMLIRMQKELRAQSARQKRQTLEQRKLDKWKQLNSDGQNSAREPLFTQTMTQHLASHRSNTVHGSRPVVSIPLPTPVSSRPHTATGVHMESSSQQQSPTTMGLQQQNMERMSRLHEIEMLQREKWELSQEKAFRFRLSQKEREDFPKDMGPVMTPESVDLWLIDPRNPQAMRPKSSKSIPSKCHRYVLVSKPKARLNLPLPSPLEEELLATRFPDQGEKVFRKYEGLLYKPPRRPAYGIEYSPFRVPLQ